MISLKVMSHLSIKHALSSESERVTNVDNNVLMFILYTD